MTIALAVALSLAVLCLASVACFALWSMWGVIKSQRAVLYDQVRANQQLQARFMAIELERAGSTMAAAQALEQARPANRYESVFPPPPPENYDEVAELAGSLG